MLDSRVGTICIILYAVGTIASYFVSFLCGSAACSLAIVVPIMPWAFIAAADLGIGFPWAVYPIFILLNTCVAYVVGAMLEWGYRRVVARER